MQDTEILNNKINQLDLIAIYRTSIQQQNKYSIKYTRTIEQERLYTGS